MAQKLSWTTLAHQDIKSIWDRIVEKGDEEEAHKQLQLIDQELESLHHFPRKFPIYGPFKNVNVRELKFRVYQVIYRIEKNGQILILSIFHAQRDTRSIMQQRKNQLV